MNSNYNLIEFGDTGNLIATAICDFNTPTKSFKKGDIVLNLQNIKTSIYTNNKTKRADSQRLDLEYTDMNISGLQCTHVPIDYQIYTIFGEEEKDFNIVYSEEICCFADGSLLLTEYVPLFETIRIEGIEDFSIDNNEDMQMTIVNSNNFISGCFYKIQYEKNVKKPFLKLDTQDADIPYLKLQLQIIGNLDKETNDSYLFIEKVRLHFTPSLNLQENSVSHCTLLFSVIDSDIKPQLVI